MTFDPGIASMRAAGTPVTIGAYPDGVAGVRVSLNVMAAKMREGRNDRRVKRWALAKLTAGGIDGRGSVSVRRKAEVLLTAFRAQTSYSPDPVGTEFIPSAAATLCLDPALCVSGDDCDGLVVALGSVFLSIGIPVRIIKQNFGSGRQEHVLLEAQDENGLWFPCDPSTNLPAGQSVRAVSEERIDPMGVVGAAGTSGAEIVTLGAVPVRDIYKDWQGTWHERRLGKDWTHNGREWVEVSPTALGFGATTTTGPTPWTDIPADSGGLYDVQAGIRYKWDFNVTTLGNDPRIASYNDAGTTSVWQEAVNAVSGTPSSKVAYLRSLLVDQFLIETLSPTTTTTGGVESWELIGLALSPGNLPNDAFFSTISLSGQTGSTAVTPVPTTNVTPTTTLDASLAPLVGGISAGKVGLIVLGTALVGGLAWGYMRQTSRPRGRR